MSCCAARWFIPESGAVGVSWNWDPTLTWSLIAAIEDNPDIKQGLFPGVGGNASSARGGGKSKLDWQWEVCKIIFAEHATYKHAFAQATTPQLRRTWSEKVKNRLHKLSKSTREYMAELGATGAGIKHEEDIDETAPMTFVNKWAEVKKAFPWFFRMRDLIGEWPSIVTTGLGNSRITSSSNMSPAPSDTAEQPVTTVANKSLPEIGDQDGISADVHMLEDSDGEDVKPDMAGLRQSVKHKATGIDNKDDSFKSSAKETPAKKQKGGVKQFEDLVIAEEETQQKRLDIEREKLQVKLEIKQAEIRSKKEVEVERLKLTRLKMEQREKECQWEHELRILQMQMQMQIMQAGPSSFVSLPRQSAFPSASAVSAFPPSNSAGDHLLLSQMASSSSSSRTCDSPIGFEGMFNYDFDLTLEQGAVDGGREESI
ncbi:hypothetical protein EWM64_g4526 [Hericium alpestre]|uniref:Uncharacterized protein n=1 Tax=Hericium alpestre TaxID=135208 RepID=A0A4Y9ZZI0_9AGAM|nr:hypothetical protein EWM64_g4526 [Hericium alpestre]